MPKPQSRFFLIGLAAGLLIVILGAVLRRRAHTFTGTVLQAPEKAPNFTLTTADGEISLRDFEDKVVLLFFGYTFCPDVCPTTLNELAQAMDILGKKAKDVQVIFVSVDPARDTPEHLAEYVNLFNPNFIGATASEEEIASLAALYGIFYEKDGDPETDTYLVNHTATVLVIDQQGHLKLLFPFGTSAEAIAADIAYLLR